MEQAKQKEEGAAIAEPLANSAKVMSEVNPADVAGLLNGPLGGQVL